MAFSKCNISIEFVNAYIIYVILIQHISFEQKADYHFKINRL